MSKQEIFAFWVAYGTLVTLMLVAGIVWLSAGFFAWTDRETGKKPHFFCFHDIEYGGGGMGDAVQCTKCGLDTYDGFNSHLWIYRMLGRVRNI